MGRCWVTSVLVCAVSHADMALAQDGAAETPLRSDWFGAEIACAGDVDGDGRDDLLIAELDPRMGAGEGARLWVASAHDGRLLVSVPLPGAQWLSHLAAVGDVDGDGRGDFCAVLQPSALFSSRELRLWSGRDGLELARRELQGALALCVARAGPDLEGLGPVIACGWSMTPGPRRSSLLSVGDHALGALFELVAPPDVALFHERSVASVEDLDGDGSADLVARFADSTGRTRRLQAYSGRTGALLVRWSCTEALPWASDIVSVRDHDGDGLRDLAVLFQPARRDTTEGSGLFVQLHAGSDGSALGREPKLEHSRQGHSVRLFALGDLDGDGTPELAGTNANGLGYPMVRVWDGATSALRYELFEERGAELPFGSRYVATTFASLGDIDGDAVPDLALGGANFWGHEQGVVQVHSGNSGKLLRTITKQGLWGPGP